MTREIINVTSVVEKMRKDIRLCDEVSDKTRKIKNRYKR